MNETPSDVEDIWGVGATEAGISAMALAIVDDAYKYVEKAFSGSLECRSSYDMPTKSQFNKCNLISCTHFDLPFRHILRTYS